jgi:hypothetical protein
MISLHVELSGLEDVMRDIEAMPAQIDRAMKRTIRKGTQYAAGQVIRGLATANNIPQRILRNRRVKTRIGDELGSVWIGHNPVAVSYLGTPRQTKSGAKVGARAFPGAFVATMPTGHTGVFRRRGQSRLPIQEVMQPLDKAGQVADEVVNRLPDRLRTILLQELNFEANVRD